MAEQEGGAPYQFTPEGGKTGNSSRDYTGKGYANYPNNDQYDGDYHNGVREGKGKYIYANGDKYQGDFKNNKKHGIGRLTYKDKGQYYGQFQNGAKHGQGTYLYSNKDTYSGWWQFGKKSGEGTYTYADSGMKLIGQWKENHIVQGKWVFPNGTFYEGRFANDKPTNQGTWYFQNGNNLKGNYTQTIIPNEDPDDKKINMKLDWQSQGGLSNSAWMVNSHQNF